MSLFFVSLVSLLAGIFLGFVIFLSFNKRLIKSFFAEEFSETSKNVINELKSNEEREDDVISSSISNFKKDLGEEIKSLSKELTAAKTTWKDNKINLEKSIGSLTESHAKWIAGVSNSSVRGSLAEESVKTMLKSLGFVEGVSYVTQKTLEGDEGDLRPDIVIKNSKGGSIIIDSKAPMKAYIEALDVQDPQRKNELLKKHAKDTFNHVKELSSKDYSAYEMGSPDFVIMWLDNVSVFTAAVEIMPDIVEKAASLKVLICPPSLVYACLKVIDLSFSQQEMAGNANRIIALGEELHRRAKTFSNEFEKIDNGLESAKKALSKSYKSWNSRLLPTLRKFEDLSKIKEDKKLTDIDSGLIDRIDEQDEGVINE